MVVPAVSGRQGLLVTNRVVWAVGRVRVTNVENFVSSRQLGVGGKLCFIAFRFVIRNEIAFATQFQLNI